MESQDWQISCKTLKERGTRLLHSSQWTDCTFLVGHESNRVTIEGHRLLLAMASPVFEAMFYGGIPERNEPIPILDVQPEAFRALLEYIYSDTININSFDKACELCYAAKKYMLPHLVQECTNFLWSDLNPSNACRAYEFAKLFEEPVLMDKCLQIICTQTFEVLSEASFEEVDIATVVTIFEQDHLSVNSELELFDAAARYANAQLANPNQTPRFPIRYSQSSSAIKASRSGGDPATASTNTTTPTAAASTEGEAPTGAGTSERQPPTSSTNTPDAAQVASPPELTIKNALQKIRFLTLTPQQFAEGPARSNLLSQAETFAILMNISSSRSDIAMPDGFSTSSKPRNKVEGFRPVDGAWVSNLMRVRRSASPTCSGRERLLMPPFNDEVSADATMLHHGIGDAENREANKHYCYRSFVHEMDCLNTTVLDASVTFSVNRNVCVTGIQIPTQVLGKDSAKIPSGSTYPELLYAHLLDSENSRLTYTHYTSRVNYGRLLDVTFNRPIYIQRNKIYKVDVVFNKYGWYPIGSGSLRVNCDNCIFNFGIGPTSGTVRDGLIRSIMFTY